MMSSISSSIYWPLVDLLWRDVCPSPLPTMRACFLFVHVLGPHLIVLMDNSSLWAQRSLGEAQGTIWGTCNQTCMQDKHLTSCPSSPPMVAAETYKPWAWMMAHGIGMHACMPGPHAQSLALDDS